VLTNETNEDSIDGNSSSKKIHKPTTIFVHGVIKYGKIMKGIKDIAKDEEYCKKCLEKELLK